ncbi:MAG: DUF3179 domain-containing protein [Lautropia sp.]|nr:DUF3179 domain-containing protein [Lautropia sp.]
MELIAVLHRQAMARSSERSSVPDDRILGVFLNDQARAYPVRILN